MDHTEWCWRLRAVIEAMHDQGLVVDGEVPGEYNDHPLVRLYDGFWRYGLQNGWVILISPN